jgi:hypothetical protein
MSASSIPSNRSGEGARLDQITSPGLSEIWFEKLGFEPGRDFQDGTSAATSTDLVAWGNAVLGVVGTDPAPKISAQLLASGNFVRAP